MNNLTVPDRFPPPATYDTCCSIITNVTYNEAEHLWWDADVMCVVVYGMIGHGDIQCAMHTPVLLPALIADHGEVVSVQAVGYVPITHLGTV